MKATQAHLWYKARHQALNFCQKHLKHQHLLVIPHLAGRKRSCVCQSVTISKISTKPNIFNMESNTFLIPNVTNIEEEKDIGRCRHKVYFLIKPCKSKQNCISMFYHNEIQNRPFYDIFNVSKYLSLKVLPCLIQAVS